jgi:hypothetical protein
MRKLKVVRSCGHCENMMSKVLSLHSKSNLPSFFLSRQSTKVNNRKLGRLSKKSSRMTEKFQMEIIEIDNYEGFLLKM